MKPVSMRMVVDLPAPFGPRKPSTSPRAHREADLLHGVHGPEPFGQAVEPDHLGHRRQLLICSGTASIMQGARASYSAHAT